MKFKQSVYFRVENETQMNRIQQSLVNLGYRGHNYNNNYIVSYDSGIFSTFDSNVFEDTGQTKATSEEEFLALAAMVDDDQPHVGEIFNMVSAGGWGYNPDNNGCLAVVTKTSTAEWQDLGGQVPTIAGRILNPKINRALEFSAVPIGTRNYDHTLTCRKATIDEIRAYYATKQTTVAPTVVQTERKVIGYRTKIDLPDIKAGTEGRPAEIANGQRVYDFAAVNSSWSNRRYSSETLKGSPQFFEPIYEPMFKVGDWVFNETMKEAVLVVKFASIGETDKQVGHKNWATIEAVKEHESGIYKRLATKEEIELVVPKFKEGDIVWQEVDKIPVEVARSRQYCKTTFDFTYPESANNPNNPYKRLATKEEIEAATEIRIAGYKLEVKYLNGEKVAKFGCQVFGRSELIELRNFLSRSGTSVNPEVKINGTVITVQLLNKVLDKTM